MNETAMIAPVRKSISVKAPVGHAFDVFTSGLSRWWPLDHGVGKQPIQKVLIEPRLGGPSLRDFGDGRRPSPRSFTGSRRIASSCSGRSTRNGSRKRR